MRPERVFQMGIFFLLGLQACAGFDEKAGWVKPGPLTAQVEPTAVLQSAPPALSRVEDGKVLRVGQAVALALERNPGLKALARQVRALEYDRVQAGRWSNPSLEISAEDWLGSGELEGVEQLQLTAQLSQNLDIGGKRGADAQVVARERDTAAWHYELARLTLQHKTRRTFAGALLAQENLRLRREEVELARKVLVAFSAQAEAGRVAGMEQERARVALELAELARDESVLAWENARSALAACWGAERLHVTELEGSLAVDVARLKDKTLLAALQDNPRLRQMEARVLTRQAQVERERAEAVPDLSLSLGYRYLHGPGDSAMVAGVGLPLPLFDRNQDGRQAAQERWMAARDELEAVRSEMTASMLKAARRLETARRAARVLAEDVLPRAKKTYAAIEEGTRIGRFGYLDLLEAQRTLFQVRHQALQALHRVNTASLDLEYFLTKPLRGAPKEQ